MGYAEFLIRKTQEGSEFGFDPVWMPEFLFDFQAEMVTDMLARFFANEALPSIGPTPLAVTVLTEEVGEVARACLESDKAQMRAELVQVAAVAVAMIEGIDASALDSHTGMPIWSVT